MCVRSGFGYLSLGYLGLLAGTALAFSVTASSPATAQAFAPTGNPNAVFQQVINEDEDAGGGDIALRPDLRKQVVSYATTEPAGTIIVDTPHTYLYYVLGGGRAIRYGIGVGREGFTWSGVKTIARKAEWPDWYPPAEMIERQPYLPRMMAGGPGNPLGARAMYLGGTVYRIHGTNAPNTIGKQVSSGCIRMLNEDVMDLFNRAQVGTRVVVLPDHRNDIARVTTQTTGRQALTIAPRRGSSAAVY